VVAHLLNHTDRCVLVYHLSIAVHGYWGVCCTLTFWGALIKATRNWAPITEQGKEFGISKSGRGIAELASSTAFLAMFAKLGSGKLALSWVIILFSITDILIGLMVLFTLVDPARENSESKEEKQKIGLKQIIMVLKMPVVWLISLVLLAAYKCILGILLFYTLCYRCFSDECRFRRSDWRWQNVVKTIICFGGRIFGR